MQVTWTPIDVDDVPLGARVRAIDQDIEFIGEVLDVTNRQNVTRFVLRLDSGSVRTVAATAHFAVAAPTS